MRGEIPSILSPRGHHYLANGCGIPCTRPARSRIRVGATRDTDPTGAVVA